MVKKKVFFWLGLFFILGKAGFSMELQAPKEISVFPPEKEEKEANCFLECLGCLFNWFCDNDEDTP